MSVQVEEVSADYTDFLSAAEIEEYIRDDDDAQTNILPLLIESAIRQAEGYCNATFGSKEMVCLFTNVKACNSYYLPFAPIRSINAVYTVADDGTETAITSGFTVHGLTRKYIQFTSYGTYKIEYSAGAALPLTNINPAIKEGVLTILSENFENRTEVLAGESLAKMPRNSMVKLGPFRNNVF